MAIINYSLSYRERIIEAAREYTKRKEREVHPDGEFDNAGRCYPSEDEELTCCNNIRTPSRSWPYSLLRHCRSLEHVTGLYGVLKNDVRKYIRCGILPEIKEGYYYKLVAVVENRYLSIFDGETEYEIGKTLIEEVYPDFEGGFYVYKTIEEAEDAVFPHDSKLRKAPKAVLKMKCSGDYCKYEVGKIAFSQVTPVQVISKETNKD